MTTVSSVTTTPSPATPASSLSATEDTFLKLLVTQMRNQDPLSPLDNAQVTSQLAQLSTVGGINKLNDTMTGLSNAFNQSQSLQSASMIGHGVLTPGSAIVLSSSGGALGAVDLPQNVDSLGIVIKDASGQVVHTASLGAQPKGTTMLQWDGVTDQGVRAPSGSYTFEVQALAAGKQVSGLSPLQFGYVNSVTLGSDGATLNLNGIGPVAMSQVKQIL